MDVTSLLNAASTIREETAKEIEFPANTPVRNRTPWDAGGYSLPINSASQNETLTTSDSNPLDESKDSTLVSSNNSISNHKPSDSRSSISSFASTTSNSQQSQHSRLSSISTVSSFYPLSVITDIEKYSKTSATPTPDQGSELQNSKFI